MSRHRKFPAFSATLLLGSALALPATFPAQSATAATSTLAVHCVATAPANAPLAKKMAAQITAKLQGRGTAIGLNLYDLQTGVTCWYQSNKRFYAASVIKATILGALMRRAQEQHRQLTATETRNAWLMITQSSNNAATALWKDVGNTWMQHFLNLAGMRETQLDYAWGLTKITAHDELLLLGLLSGPNNVLNKASRVYAQYLMAHVIASQRWGVPAGTPTNVIVHVKNGWLPYPGRDWEINSIGSFTTASRAYLIVMLTYGNPSMAYGIATIEGAAEVIHALLNPGEHAMLPPSRPNPTWGNPDEPIPHR